MEAMTTKGMHAAQTSSMHSALMVLADLLTQEQELLLGRDTDALPELVERKNRLLADVQHMLVPGVPSAPGRQELHSLLGRVRQLNRVNGELIQARLVHTRQALNALQQAAQPDAAHGTLYGADGQQAVKGQGRSLGQG